ncbi:hypothetical protein LGZ99_24025 [Photorhabdus temperata]|uniref:Uncharacterized protein n=2 Tax=Photorhabdus temperata TaxID=574560 RepID=A0A081RSA8_PHOTE|nr:hypothetical protein [Photorhabdus temperata]KER01561.1 hypothetical protein MEG1DRAFT_03852 [Photorhabdus temperata subsp. temperata Meg1]MCT8350177.1 hypothetical protein [Photorhabdus temperata]
MKYELIPTVTLPTQEEVENIINQLKSELSGFDAHKSLSCVMVRELHKRLSKSIKCKVSVEVTKECMDAMRGIVSENDNEIMVIGFDDKLVIRSIKGN